jgi:hypothetical protein
MALLRFSCAASKERADRYIVTHMGAAAGTATLRRLHPKLQMMQERVKKMRTHAEAQESPPDPGFESACTHHGCLNHCARCRRRVPYLLGRAPPPEPVVDRRLTIDPRHAAPADHRLRVCAEMQWNAHLQRWRRQPAEDDDLLPFTLCMGSGGGGASAGAPWARRMPTTSRPTLLS